MLRSERNRIEVGDWVLEQLWPEDSGYGFDCGNDDLNEFFTIDVIEHDRNLLTKNLCVHSKRAHCESRI
jgi:hypothetical protein